MDGDPGYSIGELAARTGLTVKASGSTPTAASWRRPDRVR
jgi:hypothetical protein